MYNHVHVCLPGSEEKVKTCKEYGAHLAINYKQQNFATEVLSFTDNKGMVYSTCTGMYTVQMRYRYTSYSYSYIVPSAVDEHVYRNLGYINSCGTRDVCAVRTALVRPNQAETVLSAVAHSLVPHDYSFMYAYIC